MIRAGLVTRDGQGEIVTGLVMMLIGENCREVVETGQGGDRAAPEEPAAGRDDRAALRPHPPDQPDARHRPAQPDGGRRAGHRRPAGAPGQPPRRPDRGAGDPALDALRGQHHARDRGHGQPDEPGRDRLRHDRRFERDHDRELRPAAGPRGGHAAEARDRPRRGHRGPQADDVRRADHRDRLPADPGPAGDRGQAVPADGPDGDLRPGRVDGPLADPDAGARLARAERRGPGEGGLADPVAQARSISRCSMRSSAARSAAVAAGPGPARRQRAGRPEPGRRVHAPAQRGGPPDRGRAHPVGLARRGGGGLDADREHPQEVPRGPDGLLQDRPARDRQRRDGRAPDRRLDDAQAAGRVAAGPDPRRPDRGDGQGA